MAVGGWDYYRGDFYLSGDTDAAHEFYLDAFSALVTSMPNWSVQWAREKYGSNYWFIVWRNSVTNAELAYVICRDGISGNLFHANNNVLAATIAAGSYEYSQWFAYCPPGATFNTALDPDESGFVPSTGFLFSRIDRDSGEAARWGWYRWEFLVRDNDDLIVLWSPYSDTSMDVSALALMGGCAVPIHATDTGSLKNEAMIASNSYVGTADLSGSTVKSQFFAADGTTRLVSGPVLFPGKEVSEATQFMTQSGVWPWLRGVLYKSGNPTTEGVVTGNGIKGYLNDEWYRWFQGNGPAFVRQRFDSSNFVFVRSGAMIGWDASNGEMR